MKLIAFKGIESFSVPIYKRETINMEQPDGKIIKESVATTDIDRVQTQYTGYIIPENKIDMLVSKKGKFYVNNIEVNEENWESVIKQLSMEINYGK